MIVKSDFVRDYIKSNNEYDTPARTLCRKIIKDHPDVFGELNDKSIEKLRNTVRRVKKKLGITSKVNTEGKNLKDSYEYSETKNGATLVGEIESDKTDKAKILDDFLELHKIDLKVWEIDRFQIGAHDVTMQYRDQDLTWQKSENSKGEDVQLMEGHSKREPGGVTKTNYSIKVFLKPRKKDIVTATEDAIRELIKEVPMIDRFPEVKGLKKRSGILLEMATFDAHLGKLAAMVETSYRNYDLDIALEDLDYAVDKNLGWAAQQANIEEIEYIIGQDLFHVDNMDNHTTHGTHTMDVDGRMPKIMKKSLEVIYSSILKCRSVAPVTVRWVPGNHDYFASMMVCAAIDAFFTKDPHINVDLFRETNGMMTRKARLWGKTLVGWTHKIKGREGAWVNELAQMFPDLWAKSVFREWHVGDQHQKKTSAIKTVPEFTSGGVMIRQLTALSPVDKWHFENLFTDAVPGGEALLWSKEHGVYSNQTAWTGQYEKSRNKIVKNEK